MNESGNIPESAAEAYDAHAAPQAALAGALAAFVPPEARKGRAVEFGAGTGFLTRRLLPWDGPYLATDASAAMKRVGQTRCPFSAWAQRDARDAAGLGPLDWILSCNMLQWIEDPAPVLRSWRGALRPGGNLAVALFVRGTLGELHTLLPGASQLRWRSSAEWAELVTAAGFSIHRAERWEHAAHYSSSLALLRELHALGLAPRRLATAGRLRSALRMYDELFAEKNGVRASWRGWLALAKAV